MDPLHIRLFIWIVLFYFVFIYNLYNNQDYDFLKSLANNLRIAILAAVSTKVQSASDKVSLPDQIRKSRAIAAERGWIETAGPYEIPGASRTKYVDLSVAERAIPPLHQMLEAAKRGEYDLLVVYHLNRFRDLLDPVFRSLGGYRVQLYSVSQPVEPVPPERYNYETSDTMRIVVTMTQMTSQSEISEIRKRYNIGMPARVIDRGLPPNRAPYGYHLNRNRKLPPDLDDDQAAAVRKMMELSISGMPLKKIAQWLDEQHIPAPEGEHWHFATVHRILINPFYAGFVSWGKTKIVRDLRAGTRQLTRNKPENIIRVPGKHQPIWDEATMIKLVDLYKKRWKNKARAVNQFTRLLSCGECGARLWRFRNGPRGEYRAIWRCIKSNEHPSIPHTVLLDQFAARLVNDIRIGKPKVETGPQQVQPDIDAEILKLRSQKKRLADAYQVGAMPLDEFSRRIVELDAQVKSLEAKKSDITFSQQSRQAWLATLGELEQVLDILPAWLREEDPAQVNRMLKVIINYVVIGEGGVKEIVYK